MSHLQFRPAIFRFRLSAFVGLFLLIHIGLAATPASFSLAAAIDQGPGGPILLVTSPANAFSKYYAEILRTEGLNEFGVAEISQVSKTLLQTYDVVILGEMRIADDQVAFFEEYVKNGGNLIAMRPDMTNKRLMSLLGIAATSATMSDKYLVLSSPTGAATSLVKDPIQFHGAADLYALDGAVPLALLYSDRATATSNSAVAWRSFGSGPGRKGQTATFAFDVARSIVYTRQGNPIWERQLRDTSPGCPLNGTQPCVIGAVPPPITSHDLFFGNVNVDQPWLDFSNIAIPQADELQRFLANLILLMNQDTKPLPRFWYFPRGKKAVVIMTGDGHTGSVPQGRFDMYKRFDTEGCSVDNWECVRSTAYLFSGSSLDAEQAARYNQEGFEISIHVNVYNNTTCSDWPTEAVLRFFYREQLKDWQTKYAGVPPPSTQRTHCVVWSDYTTQAQVELSNGIRLDTTYYHYPYTWVLDRPGFFTGSGMPMRFAATDGTMIDVYQAATQFTDQSFQTFPKTAQELLDRALGPEGYYGAFTANMHVDGVVSMESDAVVRTALDRGVSVISAKQMLTWLDGRNSSSFGNFNWAGGFLSFKITAGIGANGLQAMLPTTSSQGALVAIDRNGSAIAFTTQEIKGIEYAFFPADDGFYVANYTNSIEIAPSVITSNPPEVTDSRLATFEFESPDPNSRFECSLDTAGFTLCASPKTFVDLNLGDHRFRVRPFGSSDGSDHEVITSWTIVTELGRFTDATAGQFAAGAFESSYIAQITDGEILLPPTTGIEFYEPVLPFGWLSKEIDAGGSFSTNGGLGIVDGADVATSVLYGAGHSIEFVATFTGDRFQSVGFLDLRNSNVQALFTTFFGGVFYVRTNNDNGSSFSTSLPRFWLGSPHRYRIDWTSEGVVFSIDGQTVATHSISFSTRMSVAIEDAFTGGSVLSVDWLRTTPYSPAGAFTSQVFDAGAVRNWAAASWSSATPPGTALGVSVRTGSTPVPDDSWTDFIPLAGSGKRIAAPPGRYIQYRSDLATTDPDQTPVLNDITISYVIRP